MTVGLLSGNGKKAKNFRELEMSDKVARELLKLARELVCLRIGRVTWPLSSSDGRISNPSSANIMKALKKLKKGEGWVRGESVLMTYRPKEKKIHIDTGDDYEVFDEKEMKKAVDFFLKKEAEW